MEEALIKRILPHSEEAERSVVGCMMMSRDAIMVAAEILTGFPSLYSSTIESNTTPIICK